MTEICKNIYWNIYPRFLFLSDERLAPETLIRCFSIEALNTLHVKFWSSCIAVYSSYVFIPLYVYICVYKYTWMYTCLHVYVYTDICSNYFIEHIYIALQCYTILLRKEKDCHNCSILYQNNQNRAVKLYVQLCTQLHVASNSTVYICKEIKMNG